MKKSIKIDVSTPCSQHLDNFSSITSTAFCQKCSKDVVDFTNKSDREILEFLTNKDGKTCGRFNASQLKAYPAGIISKPRPSLKWLGAGLMGLSLLLPSIDALGQTHSDQTDQAQIKDLKQVNPIQRKKYGESRTIKGTVTCSMTQESLPGVNVYLKGTDIGTITDIDGQFKFNTPVKVGDILTFSFIGLQSVEYAISDIGELDIAMDADMTQLNDVVVTGEVAVDHLYTSKGKFWQKIAGVFK